MTSIDLNCDMGESYGPWKMGDDAGIMPHITSVNVACGAHAGDPNVMASTVRLARQHGVAVGAHPGYPDLAGFGRRSMKLSSDEVIHTVLFQLGALRAIARSEGVGLSHVKPHGALYNQACEDRGLAEAIVEAICRFSSFLPLVGLPSSQLESAARERDLTFLREGFADRAYEPSGLLRNRENADALVASPEGAADQALQLARGEVAVYGGTALKFVVDTICIHGDTPGAANIAREVRRALEAAHIQVTAIRRPRR